MSLGGGLFTKSDFEQKEVWYISVMKYYAGIIINYCRNITADMEGCFWNLPNWEEMHNLCNINLLKIKL